MHADEVDFPAVMPQPCDEWLALVTAADSAGRWAARQLACRCCLAELGRGGSVSLHAEPIDAPVVAWLHQHAYGTRTSTGLLIPVTVPPQALHPARQAVEKAPSLLVRHAYAAAFSTVLAEEAGVAADIRFVPAPVTVTQLLPAARATTSEPGTASADMPGTDLRDDAETARTPA